MPALHEHVVDRSGLLPSETKRELEQSLVEFERTSGHQVVVHITPSLEGLEIEDYSIQIADAWKVGQKNLDNGVILTVAPNERKVRIEVGYGLEGVLPDALAGRIVRDVIVPEFKAGRMDEGVVAGTRAIVAIIAGEKLPLPERPVRPRASPWLVLLWIVVVLALLLARGLFYLPPFGGPGIRRTGRYGQGGLGRSGGFGGGGGGFGGGGFSGGGGGFGGGGASGSW